MAAEIGESIRNYLTDLVRIQSDLVKLFRDRATSFYGDNPSQIQVFVQEKTELVQKLNQKLLQREQLLKEAQAAGFAAPSLQEVVDHLPDEAAVESKKLLELSIRLTLHLRQESWKQWVYIQRSHQHYAEVLDLIAHQGKKAPTYDEKSKQASSGGAILDASA